MSHNPVMPNDVAQELARQGEARLEALLMTAIAADARANTLAGFFGTIGIGVGAAVLAAATSDHPVGSLVVPGLISAAGFLVAAAICVFVGAPQSFRIAGADSADLRTWSWDQGRWRSLTELFDATAIRYADAIKMNVASLEKQAKRIHGALIIAGGSQLVAAFVFLGLWRN